MLKAGYKEYYNRGKAFLMHEYKRGLEFFPIIIMIVVVFCPEVFADTIYLRNGRSIDGFVKSEDENCIEFDIGIGLVKFRKEEISRVYLSTPEESEIIRQRWVKKEKRQEQAKRMREFAPQHVNVVRERGHIIVEALINKRVSASLLLDTGASYVVLSNDVWNKLKKNRGREDKEETLINLQLADGRRVKAKLGVLETLSVQGIEAKDVNVVVLLEEAKTEGFKDGLLGMSFLNRFNFKVDQKNSKLILEKLK